MKGQVKQVFVYIMTIIIVGFIILISARYFPKIDETRCDAEYVLMQREIAKAFSDNLLWGREALVDLGRPCEYEALCFVDARVIAANQASSGDVLLSSFHNLEGGSSSYVLADPDITGIMKDSAKDGIEKNVFLIRKKEVLPVSYEKFLHLPLQQDIDSAGSGPCAGGRCEAASVGTESIPRYVFCMPARAGKFSFRLLGEGRSVLVKPK